MAGRWMGAAFCVYYSIWALFSTYLQKELNWTPGMMATPLFWANIVVFAGFALWGAVADKRGRRLAIIVPCVIAVFVTPLYPWTTAPLWIVFGFILQGVFGGSIYGQNPSYLSERSPTEVRATASGFVYHQSASFALPMMVSTIVFLLIVILAVALGPETKGRILTADLETMKAAEAP